jgi:hypothetical protein
MANYSYRAAHIQQQSPFPLLPGEIRNLIYNYAYQEQCIAVERKSGLYSRLTFVAVLETSNTNDAICTYPLSALLATTTVCRQVYAETAALPMALNVFYIGTSIGLRSLRVECLVTSWRGFEYWIYVHGPYIHCTI